MQGIIFAGGTIQEGSAVEQTLAKGGLIIAADSGAQAALERALVPAFVVGDFDSLNDETRKRLEQLGSQFVSVLAEKDETDTELAVLTALEQGADSITLLGALGGSRFDHSIANILLLAEFETTSIELVDGDSRGWLLRGPGEIEIKGKKGDLLSLFPLTGSARGVETAELYYPLRREVLRFGRPRGISNVLLGRRARVALDEGLLLIIHTSI